MRTLRFVISGQSLKPAPDCDFTGLAPGTQGYLQARFTFDGAWDGCKKAASFFCGEREYAVPVREGMCEIPAQALARRTFGVRVTGVREGYRIVTGRLDVRQWR